MIAKIYVEPEAEAELEEAAERYEDSVPGLGREFLLIEVHEVAREIVFRIDEHGGRCS